MDLTPAQREALLDAAREVIRGRVFAAAPILRDASAPQADIPPPSDPSLLQQAGCFVSLHTLSEPRRLRGCIGRLDASKPLWTAVHDAAAAVLEDPRFVDRPVVAEELSNLDVEITVLSPLRPARDVLDFDPIIDGISLTIGTNSGCFLPQVARETGWTREQLLDRLCTEKLGLPCSHWRSPQAKLQKFSTLIIGPAPFHVVVSSRGNATPAC